MDQLIKQRRPSASLIKLIESIGILLGVPLSKKKSPYKAPLPSNYDETLTVLDKDFYGCLNKLSELRSGVIEHDIATNFYNKMLEPGFDYEDAVNNGGLIVRELYNAALLVLLKLQSDSDRVPVDVDNILLVMDGSRSSYCAIDFATHIRRHGSLHIGIDRRLADPQQSHYLSVDLRRRCVDQYKLPDHCCTLHDLEITSVDGLATQNDLQINNNTTSVGAIPGSILPAIQNLVQSERISILTLPLARPQEFDANIAKKDLTLEWALSSSFGGDVALVHGNSYRRPFTEVNVQRTHLVYIPFNVSPTPIFLRALRFCRPGDALCVVSVFPSRRPAGENRETRFDFGSRHAWHSEEEVKARETDPDSDRVGWNDALVEQFQQKVEEMLQKSAGISGFVRIERIDSPYANQSLADELSNTGEGESTDFYGQKALYEKLLKVALEEQCSSVLFYYGSDMNDPALNFELINDASQAPSPTRGFTQSAFPETVSASSGIAKQVAEMSSVRIREKLLRGFLQQANSFITTLVLLKPSTPCV